MFINTNISGYLNIVIVVFSIICLSNIILARRFIITMPKIWKFRIKFVTSHSISYYRIITAKCYKQ